MAVKQVIIKKANRLVSKTRSRDPFEMARQSGILIHHENIGTQKGMYLTIKRSRFILINENLDYHLAKVVCAHELGHDQLHRHFAKEPKLQDSMLYDMSSQPEREANLFAAEVLLDDSSILELFHDNVPIQCMASILCVPREIILLKLMLLDKIPVSTNLKSDFLKS